jgi:diguanylate cyclase (GGDEF)-like protein/PAS domain S-box-containing protein
VGRAGCRKIWAGAAIRYLIEKIIAAGMQPSPGFLGDRARPLGPPTENLHTRRPLSRLPGTLLGRALNAISESSVITDKTQRILFVNAAFTTVTGFTKAEVLGHNCRLLQGPGTDPLTVAALRATLARGETYRGEILNYRKDGTPFWNALTVSPLRDDTGTITHFVSVQRDVTEKKTLQDRLRFLALHDPVTGLPNRTALDQHLSRRSGRTMTGNKAAAVGIIDLDDFKTVNDTFGHEAGDVLLAELSRRLRDKLREPDFLAHPGGDEFVVIIEGLDPDTAEDQLGSILERLHRAVDTDFVLSPTVSVTARMSMGLSLWSPNDVDGNAVLRRADAALYHLKARKAGHSRWWHLDGRPAAAAPDGHGPLPEAPEAAADSGESRPASGPHPYLHRLFTGGLRMFFQPVIDLRTGQVHLLEALARLALEDGTILPPGVFLPLLTDEDNEQLFNTGLEQALRQLAAWDAHGHRLRVSVNLPPSALLNPDCAQRVASALDRHNIAPHRLVVELLEDHAEDSDIQRRNFNELLTLGVGMAMDDLGAGHSSLRRLTAAAFSTVKIDHRILTQLRTSPIPTLTFLTTMIQMGRDMGWHVVAEGLEDAGITEAAAILGIPYGQGYHLARPMPAESVPAWIADFTLPPRQGPVRTLPGALAYHWQLARLDSPHPGPLNTCPMTALLAREPSAGTAIEWHRQQHAGAADHLVSATALLHWLTNQITDNHHTTPNRAVPGLSPRTGIHARHPGKSTKEMTMTPDAPVGSHEVQIRYDARGRPLALRHDGRLWAVDADTEAQHWFGRRDSWGGDVGDGVPVENWRVQARSGSSSALRTFHVRRDPSTPVWHLIRTTDSD